MVCQGTAKGWARSGLRVPKHSLWQESSSFGTEEHKHRSVLSHLLLFLGKLKEWVVHRGTKKGSWFLTALQGIKIPENKENCLTGVHRCLSSGDRILKMRSQGLVNSL